MKKVQKIKFTNCPYCGQGQFVMPKLGEEFGSTECGTCERTFDATEDLRESQ